ncbi:PASTA domain-containing protein, partial [Staphylococcus saprophyticus]|uniref:PASTA domain-containing protein n=1 Tax=Staphylococcus saprophyticus TaxID=29385 RepID=UPI0037039B4A
SDLKYTQVPQVQRQQTQKAQDKLNSKSLQPILIPDPDKITKQSLTPNKKLLPNTKLLLLTHPHITIPDMSRSTKQQLLPFQNLPNLNITTKPTPFLSQQSTTKPHKLT